jgi:CDGSH-type Zn-finger protein
MRGKEYSYCTCGLAATQPLCDGACEGTRFAPLPFSVTKEQSTLLLCACKRTQDPPFCDGRHVHIGWDDLQW